MTPMRVPTTEQLLDLWEGLDGQPPTLKVLSLLRLAWPARSEEELRQLPVGERDGLLAKLHVALFGPTLELVANCPRCHEQLEFPIELDRLYQGHSKGSGEVVMGGRDPLRFRVPNSADLLAVAHLQVEEARRVLLERCLERRATATPLSEAELETIERAMEEADPRATPWIALRCPERGHRWQALFDLVDCFWRKLESWLLCQLIDVHLLAQAYGWSEREILAMRPRRRKIYLEMIS